MRITNEQEKSLTELKAAAYDAIAQKEFWQNELNIINQAIAAKMQQEQMSAQKEIKSENGNHELQKERR